MVTLRADITASETILPVSTPDVDPGSFYTVGSEAIRVFASGRDATGRSFERRFWSVERGVAGTTAASHSSGATLTRYYPDANSSADGAAMIRMFNPIGDMPDEFYGNDNPGQGTGDMTVNADLSDGAAFLLLKGATPDGTIVATRIPMIPGSYDVPKVAAHVANGSTVDQLRDALIAAGLMAAS